MSDLLGPSDCLYFFSVIYNESLIKFDEIQKLIDEKLDCSNIFYPDFNPSLDYYAKEMGEKKYLKRILFFNFDISSKEDFVSLKLWADKLEKQFMFNEKRKINIDVGLLSKEQMLLATGKAYSHRVYLSHGVYADLNYIFANKSYQSLQWTYPDYAHDEKIKFFNWLREGLF